MGPLKLANLENLLVFPGMKTPDSITSDASILTCGCLVSESYFNSVCANVCPNCLNENANLLAEVKPLRALYSIIEDLRRYGSQQQTKKRTTSFKKNTRPVIDNALGKEPNIQESMDLIGLFYKFSRDENVFTDSNSLVEKTDNNKVEPINIQESNKGQVQMKMTPGSASPKYTASSIPVSESYESHISRNKEHDIEKVFMKSLNDKKEYNFSKCFPFYRQVSTFSTQQSKFNISHIPFMPGSLLKNSRITGSDIHTYIDFGTGNEITRFVLITEKRWELYELVAPLDAADISGIRPQLVCCGKSTGEYGASPGTWKLKDEDEILIRNDFNQNQNGHSKTDDKDVIKKLNEWTHLYCKLSSNFLVLSGTKGVMRVLNIGNSQKYDKGQPVYTYLANFPIRCVSIAPDESVIASGITAKERLSGKEQPFIVLHRLNLTIDNIVESIDSKTITIPYRDPIKIITFNKTSTHLICCTVWESRYLIIQLRRSSSNENYRKPRLIWTDLANSRNQRRLNDADDELTNEVDEYDELMMTNEGITDLQFGALQSNMIISTSCSLKDTPPTFIKLHGSSIDSVRKNSGLSDSYSIQNSATSVDDAEFSGIHSSETTFKIPEVGSSIYKFSLSPRGDGIVFVSKQGDVYLVATSNFQLASFNSSPEIKKTVVQIGEVANAERVNESASISFSADGGRVYTVDRKGVFTIFDFTKGVPGEDMDVVKCKIVTL